ncbi:MAG: hypothetical protein FJY65_05335 [Calditrichaeota bacterium]|nr:hypothetical protein [Calditrichota bacterium]
MTITIDGKHQTLTSPAPFNFGAIIEALKSSNSPPGIGFTNIKLNGTDITGADWSGLASLPAERIQLLEITTGAVRSLAQYTLASLDDFVSQLIGELSRTSDYLRAGDEVRAAQVYTRALDGIALLKHTTGLIERNIGFDTRAIPYNGGCAADVFAKLPALLDELLAAQEKRDSVLLADLIEYELIPLCEDHQRVLRLWREKPNASQD